MLISNKPNPIVLFCSYVFLVMGTLLTLPLVVSMFENGTLDQEVFALICSLCLITGYIGIKLNQNAFTAISTKELYLITICSWLLLGFIGALPFLFALQKITFVNALFESFSGITTTGSTVLSNLSQMPPSLLLWRGIIQWVGGIGIVVLSIAVLPHLRVGGMRLFATESSDWSNKTHPKANKMIVSILGIYFLLTLTCALIFFIGGMSAFDAIVHAMTTLSTGGFANYDSSFGHFSNNPILIWTASFFMIFGALPFAFYVNLLSRSNRNLDVDSQIFGFLKILGFTIFTLAIFRSFTSNESIFTVLSQVSFNIISVVTTTGFASTDYTLWGEFSVMFFFYLMFIGGCSGSTSGSVKIFRYQLAYLMLKIQLRKMTHPNGVYILKYNNRLVNDSIIRSIVVFSIMFVLTIALLAMILTLFGLDFITSISAAATAVTNVGPGLGDTIGPSGNFSGLPDTVKILLCIGMLVGRLEVMTVFVVLTPGLWNHWDR